MFLILTTVQGTRLMRWAGGQKLAQAPLFRRKQPVAGSDGGELTIADPLASLLSSHDD